MLLASFVEKTNNKVKEIWITFINNNQCSITLICATVLLIWSRNSSQLLTFREAIANPKPSPFLPPLHTRSAFPLSLPHSSTPPVHPIHNRLLVFSVVCRSSSSRRVSVLVEWPPLGGYLRDIDVMFNPICSRVPLASSCYLRFFFCSFIVSRLMPSKMSLIPGVTCAVTSERKSLIVGS